ncbi:hypothetical protein Scinn_56790 [Streptomyces virginiae]|uniref:Uncharacterized protein n=1 Tax=Streptomyces virginiae TaxID=1961 RepID=A0ABQ3NTX8_STRVG|nr:hypothetical protein Scinn_56780 [Streptomyces virginiae]GHI16216.1 hypothetical protein Scinn_56790 [Streptomyces virginiae]
MADHQEDMPSTSSSWPSPWDGSASLSRTPEAESMTSGSCRPGIGPYGCQTCCRSSASSSAPADRDWG